MSGAIAAEIEVIMQTLLEMSLSGAVMIGVIIIVRALAVNRLPKTAFLALWGSRVLLSDSADAHSFAHKRIFRNETPGRFSHACT